MKKLLIVFLLLAIFVSGVFMWWNNGLQAADSADKQPKMFIIPPGQGIREIANNLKKESLIKDPIVFFLLVKQRNLDSKIQAGDFTLSASMTALEIAEELTHGTIDMWVTIQEGKRAEEIAEILKGKMPEYQDNWIESLRANEGYLFPDTYLLPKTATIETVVTILTNNFYTKVTSIGIDRNDPSLTHIVTKASLIEREAKGDSEKPLIAGIIQNRLNDGSPLQIDATVQYAKGKRGNTWWAPVLFSEYQSVQSPYNTYLAPGLPPGPIANPGLSSLQAAKNPQPTDYYFYLHDKNGTIHYAKTIEEHTSNIQRYL